VVPKGFKRNEDGSLKAVDVIDYALLKFREYVEILLQYDENKWIQEYEE